MPLYGTRQLNERITMYLLVQDCFQGNFLMFDFNLYTLYVQQFRVLNTDDSCDLKVDHLILDIVHAVYVSLELLSILLKQATAVAASFASDCYSFYFCWLWLKLCLLGIPGHTTIFRSNFAYIWKAIGPVSCKLFQFVPLLLIIVNDLTANYGALIF